MDAPCSQWIACLPGRNGGCARPLNSIVRTQCRNLSRRLNLTEPELQFTLEISCEWRSTLALSEPIANFVVHSGSARAASSQLSVGTQRVRPGYRWAVVRCYRCRSNYWLSFVGVAQRGGQITALSSNNELERSVEHRGPPPGAQEMVRPTPAIGGVVGRSTGR
jgi:hypothetical protein